MTGGCSWGTVETQSLHGVAYTEIGGHEHVGVAERSHRDVLRRPRTDAAKLLQLTIEFHPIGAGVDGEPPLGDGAACADQGRTPGSRHRVVMVVEFGECLR